MGPVGSYWCTCPTQVWVKVIRSRLLETPRCQLENVLGRVEDRLILVSSTLIELGTILFRR